MYGDDGQPLYSWRVLLLPYLEEKKLYDDFRLNEPWDSEHNIKLLDRMPRSYSAPWTKRINPAPYHTAYHVLTGPGTPFDSRSTLQIPADFPDGTSNTLLFVEAGEPVPWTKPGEIPFDPEANIELRGLFREGFRACSVDGSYRFIRHDAEPAIVRAAITRNGGEPMPKDWSN